MFERSDCGHRTCAELMSYRTALHVDDRVVSIFALRRCRQAEDRLPRLFTAGQRGRHLSASNTYGSGGYASLSVAVGDVNGDGKPDVLTANVCVSASSRERRGGGTD